MNEHDQLIIRMINIINSEIEDKKRPEEFKLDYAFKRIEEYQEQKNKDNEDIRKKNKNLEKELAEAKKQNSLYARWLSGNCFENIESKGDMQNLMEEMDHSMISGALIEYRKNVISNDQINRHELMLKWFNELKTEQRFQ